MVLIPVMEEFDAILSKNSELVNAMEKGQYNFRELCVLFAKQLEEKAQKYSLPFLPQLTVLRGKMVLGMARSEFPKNSGRREMKNLEYKFYLTQINEAVSCVEQYFESYRKAFAECEQLCCQVITNSIYKGALKTLNEYYIKNLKDGMMSFVMGDQELAPVLIHIAGLIGKVNLEIIFDRTLSVAGVYGKIN